LGERATKLVIPKKRMRILNTLWVVSLFADRLPIRRAINHGKVLEIGSKNDKKLRSINGGFYVRAHSLDN
jgi:hypothetical protein